MSIEDINALWTLGLPDRDRGVPTKAEVDAACSFRLNVSDRWPAIYRELKAARALVDKLGDDIGGSRQLAEYDAARAETDK